MSNIIRDDTIKKKNYRKNNNKNNNNKNNSINENIKCIYEQQQNIINLTKMQNDMMSIVFNKMRETTIEMNKTIESIKTIETNLNILKKNMDIRLSNFEKRNDNKKDKKDDEVFTFFSVTPKSNSENEEKIPKILKRKEEKNNTNQDISLKKMKYKNSEKDDEMRSNLLPLMLFSDIINKINNMEEEVVDVFKEIKLPDMSKNIRKSIEKKELINFEEINIKNLDDISSYGEKFIALIDEHNKTVDAAKKKIDINDNIEKDSDNLYTFFIKRYSINPRKLMRLVKPIKILNTMIGMQDVKKNIFQFVSTFLQGSHKDGMLNTAIYGSPGIGKTDLGKILCMIYAALEIVPSTKFKLVKASDLIGQYVGQTRQKTKKIIDESDGGVLFIDEAYSLTSGDEKYSYGKECIDTINQELSENRKKLVIIIAGYENEIKEGFFKVNQGLARRFPFRYVLKEYKKEELKDIFLRMMRINEDMFLYKSTENTNVKSLDKTVTDEDIIEMFSDMRYFNNCGGDIENLITQISFANNERSIGKDPSMRNIFTKQDLIKGLEMFKYHKADTEDDKWKKMFN